MVMRTSSSAMRQEGRSGTTDCYREISSFDAGGSDKVSAQLFGLYIIVTLPIELPG